MIPEGREWTLAGPLRTFSEIKIHLLDVVLVANYVGLGSRIANYR
jgi:hypothetical protein